MSSYDKLNDKMKELWAKHRPTSVNRLATVERALKALNQGKLTEDLRAQAAREAHKLVGSLGTFGMASGSAAARTIEDFFSSYNGSSAQNSAAEINMLFDGLKREIEGR